MVGSVSYHTGCDSAYPRSPNICVQYGFLTVSRNELRSLYARHTPARILVMSRTRIPANGIVGESAAAVARPLQSEYVKPLSLVRGLRCFARQKDMLDIAITHQSKMFTRCLGVGRAKGKRYTSCPSNNSELPTSNHRGNIPQYHYCAFTEYSYSLPPTVSIALFSPHRQSCSQA